MKLVDLYCPRCFQIVEDQYIDGEPVQLCPDCAVGMKVIVNGGCGAHRERINDLPPGHDPFWKGQVETVPCGNQVSTDGESFSTPLDDIRKGTPIALNKDKSAERRDRAHFAREQRYGQRPIFVDMKRGH